MVSLSSSVITIERRSGPIITLSFAYSKSSLVICFRLSRPALRAASLVRFSKSAPVNPGVPLAIVSRLTSSASFFLREWTSKIASLALTSGLSTTTCLSKRPGLFNAGSKISGLFVAAMIINPSEESNPSISTRIWLRVCSRSS